MSVVKGTAFEASKLNPSKVETSKVETLTDKVEKESNSTFVSQELAKSDRPSLAGAKVR